MRLHSFIPLLVCALLMCSCGNSTDTYACYLSVQEKAGEGSEIVRLSSYRFLVRKADGSVWQYITSNLTNAEVSEEKKLLDAPASK